MIESALMRRGIFIAGADFAVGKTLIGCALAFAAHARGMRVGVMKPVATGCREVNGIFECEEVRGLAYAAACDVPIELMCPYRYVSETELFATPPDLGDIFDAYQKIAARSDFMIVEGYGAIASPIGFEPRVKDSTDLARMLNLDIVIVAANRAGYLSASRLAIAHAQNRGVGIAGIILNDVVQKPSASEESNLDLLRRVTDVPVLGRVRHKQPVPRAIIDPILNRIE
jgi:dethiobiotin synthetase